ncbi:MAG: VirB8/TrbF family protein [Alphaproteobacteria bacterium]|nr:VirB8/TrbF family protein [Alphaproteobacteria bacterium]
MVHRAVHQTIRRLSDLSAQTWRAAAFGLLVLALWLGFVLYRTAPQVRVVGQVFVKDIYAQRDVMYSDQLLEVLPFDADINDRKLIDEALVRYFIEMYYTLFVDEPEMTRRWSAGGPVFLLLAPDLFAEFYAEKAKVLKTLSKEASAQSVDIVNVFRTDNNFTIDFDLYAWNGMNPPQRVGKSLVLTIAYVPGRRVYGLNFSNPYGVTIVRMSETEKKDSQI